MPYFLIKLKTPLKLGEPKKLYTKHKKKKYLVGLDKRERERYRILNKYAKKNELCNIVLQTILLKSLQSGESKRDNKRRDGSSIVVEREGERESSM